MRRVTVMEQKECCSEAHFGHSWFKAEAFAQNFTHAPKGIPAVIHKEILHLNTEPV